MRRIYEYGFIDGSIILNRNFYAAEPLLRKGFGSEYLVKSVLQSIFKIARDMIKCERYFILWDKKPYHKESILKKDVGKSEYKTDRRKIEDDRLVKILGDAKLKLMQLGPKIGLTPIQFKGWEADDLAYLSALQCENRDKKSVIISFDSDWISWTRPNVDYFNMKHNSVYTYESILGMFKPIEGKSLFESKAIRDSMRGSHNNLKQTIIKKSTPTSIILKHISEGDLSDFSNYELYKAQLETFDFSIYPDFEEVSNYLKSVEYKDSLASIDEFRKLREQFKLGKLKSDLYAGYLETLNREKWSN